MTPDECGLGAVIFKKERTARLIFEIDGAGGMKIDLHLKPGSEVAISKLEESAQKVAREGLPSMKIKPGRLVPITWEKWQEEEYE